MIGQYREAMVQPDLYSRWSLSDRLQMLAFEAELTRLPRSLIEAVWEMVDAGAQVAGARAADSEIKPALHVAPRPHHSPRRRPQHRLE